ncbi:MAG: hypothetical protein ACTSSE_08280 [Candidatus Thorarchaeota archaeon]
MVTDKQYLIGAVGHGFLLFVNFCVLLAIITNFQLIVSPSTTVPFLTHVLLSYMIIHTSILLSIQLGIQVLEIIKKKFPTLLIAFYFNISDEEFIPIPLLDPIKSRIGVIVIILILSGGIILYPIFAVYGMLLLLVRLPNILLNPATLIGYFVVFLNLVPPLLLIAVAIVVLSIIMIEFKRQ